MGFLDGYKTYIGAALMAAGVFLAQVGYVELGDAMRQFGMAVSVVGVGHKLAKQ